MSRFFRIGLIVLGLVAVLGGLVAWSIEDEYGSGLDYSLMPRDGSTYVYEEHAGEEPVFVGSRDEVFEYMEQQRAAGESFVLPGAIIVAGAIVAIVGAFGGRMTQRTA
jgi:hypothetical protein